MHAGCRAQSRCDKCAAPFASTSALAKHKRFCDAASTVGKSHSVTRSLSHFQFQQLQASAPTREHSPHPQQPKSGLKLSLRHLDRELLKSERILRDRKESKERSEGEKDRDRGEQENSQQMVSDPTVSSVSKGDIGCNNNYNPMEALRLDLGLRGRANMSPNSLSHLIRSGGGGRRNMHMPHFPLNNSHRHHHHHRHHDSHHLGGNGGKSPHSNSNSPQSSPSVSSSKDDINPPQAVLNNKVSAHLASRSPSSAEALLSTNKGSNNKAMGVAATFPHHLMFPPSLPMYNPFATLPFGPQLFAAVNANARQGALEMMNMNGEFKARQQQLQAQQLQQPLPQPTNLSNGRRSRISLLSSRSPSLSPVRRLAEPESFVQHHDADDDDDEEMTDLRKEKDALPLDLSLQKTADDDEDDYDAPSPQEELMSPTKSNKETKDGANHKLPRGDGRRSRSPTPATRSSTPSSRKELAIRDQMLISAVARMTNNTSPVKKGERDSPNSVSLNNNNNNQSAFPQNNHPMRSSNNGPNGMSLETGEKKAASSAFSQIIAPRAMHPFPRFSHPPSHFPSLPPGFPPNPFNPFFHNTLSPRNDIGSSLGAQNPAWQGKVGSR